MSHESLDQFRQLVLQDRALQEQLRDLTDQEAFVALLVQLGAERGFAFSAEEVLAALSAGRRAWLMRWTEQ